MLGAFWRKKYSFWPDLAAVFLLQLKNASSLVCNNMLHLRRIFKVHNWIYAQNERVASQHFIMGWWLWNAPGSLESWIQSVPLLPDLNQLLQIKFFTSQVSVVAATLWLLWGESFQVPASGYSNLSNYLIIQWVRRGVPLGLATQVWCERLSLAWFCCDSPPCTLCSCV